MKLRLWLMVVVVCFSLMVSICPVRSANWDLATLWSNNRNSNWVWSYGCSSTNLTSWQSTFNTNTSDWLSGGSNAWITSGSSIPGLSHVTSANPWSTEVPRERVIMHTDNTANQYQCGVKWTAPYTMVVNLTGGVWMPRDLGRTNCVSLVVNGTVLINKVSIPQPPTNDSGNEFTLADAIVAGGGSASSLQNITIQSGQSVWMVCGPQNGQTGNADFVGMDFTVEEAESWSLSTLWSDSRNPNRTWTYGCTPSNLGSWQSSFDTNTSNWLGSGSNAWQVGGNSIPGLSKCSSADPWGIDWPAGRVAMHTDNTANQYQSGVQWTAPCDMTVDLTGTVWMPRNLGRTNCVSLIVNGTVLINKVVIPSTPTNTSSNPYTLASAIVAGGGSANSLQDVSIKAGQTIRLVCGPQNGETGNADFVGMDFTVTRDTPSGYYPAAVVVNPSGVTLPDGSVLGTESTTTQGIQEAITYACDYGYDLFVLPGTYSLSSALSFPPLQLKTIRMKNVTLNFSSAVTGPAISFDSTMMANVFMTGSISAPSASSGVYFHPVNLHPLDGLILGTRGVVDSYFTFGSVFANGYGVSIDSRSAAVCNTSFAFSSISSNQHGSTVQYQGSSYAADNLWESGVRSDDPIPFDLFDPDWVVVCPPKWSGEPGIVYLPGGSTLSTSGTTTAGLQEAVDYADENDLDLAVFGMGIINVDPYGDSHNYHLSDTLDFPAMSNKTVRIYGTTINYLGTETGVVVRDMYYSDIDMTGQLCASSANVNLYVCPSSGGAGVDHSSLRVQAVPADGNYGVVLDPINSSIVYSQFYFPEINGPDMGGLVICNPSSSTYFSYNYVRTLHNHNFTGYGCRIGNNSTNASRISSNTVVNYTNPDGRGATTGVEIWGDWNAIYYKGLGSALVNGAVFQSGSNDNTLYYGAINATNQRVDYGTNNSMVYQP